MYPQKELFSVLILGVNILNSGAQSWPRFPTPVYCTKRWFLSSFSQIYDGETGTCPKMNFAHRLFLEFENAEALLTSEVYLLLEHRRQQAEENDDLSEMSETFMKTLNYTSRMARFKNRETIRAVRVFVAFLVFFSNDGYFSLYIILEAYSAEMDDCNYMLIND